MNRGALQRRIPYVASDLIRKEEQLNKTKRGRVV